MGDRHNFLVGGEVVPCSRGCCCCLNVSAVSLKELTGVSGVILAMVGDEG